jgi:hypothetical protein
LNQSCRRVRLLGSTLSWSARSISRPCFWCVRSATSVVNRSRILRRDRRRMRFSPKRTTAARKIADVESWLLRNISASPYYTAVIRNGRYRGKHTQSVCRYNDNLRVKTTSRVCATALSMIGAGSLPLLRRRSHSKSCTRMRVNLIRAVSSSVPSDMGKELRL